MKNVMSVVLAIFIGAFSVLAQEGESASVDVPSYVVPVAALNTSRSFEVYANAVLVDLEQGLFMTSAHLIEWGDWSAISFFSKWYEQEQGSWLIDGNTHVAITKLIPTDHALLTTAPLAEESLAPSDTVFVQGYALAGFKDGELVFEPYSIQSFVSDISDEFYMFLEAEQFFPMATIGSPVIKDGRVVGFLHDINPNNDTQAKAIPVSRAKESIEGARRYFETFESPDE
ncbi:hypothetical protein MYX06_04590 [Patescibacteria group bacterium AH-259-L05]|nr:hypothetical protein [Patescibacteria group bacterium AH-259-L05]